jgi:hypothetical protein
LKVQLENRGQLAYAEKLEQQVLEAKMDLVENKDIQEKMVRLAFKVLLEQAGLQV